MRFFILAAVCVLIAGASAKPTISLRELINEILKEKETEGASDISKRQQCPAKFASNPSHTACLNNPRRQDEGVSQDEANDILARHNELRRGVNPKATNMKTMRWDDEIAMIAQKWASHCQYGHDEDRNRYIPNGDSVGQNVASYTGDKDWMDTIQRWYDEVKIFKYGSADTSRWFLYGHYTQLVWADTYLLGCGYAKCGADVGHFYVCNYGPSGNRLDMINTPYKTDGSSNPSGNNNAGNNNNNNNNGGSNNNNGGSGNNGGNSGSDWNTKDGCTIDGHLIPANSSKTWREGGFWLKTCTCTKSGSSKSYSCGFRYDSS